MTLSPRILTLALALSCAPAWAQTRSFPIPEAPGGSGASVAAPLPKISGPLGKFEPEGDRVYHGASVPSAWSEGALKAEMDGFQRASGKRISVVTWFASLYEGGRMTSWKQNYGPNLARVRNAGALSLVKFSTADSAFASTKKIALASEVADGKFDKYLEEFASTVKEFGSPVFISLDHEMNGDWYAYSAAFPGSKSTASDYKAAWRHTVELFRKKGVSNVAWVWAPNVPDVGGLAAREYYPGDDVVDWVGPSFYSGNPINNLRSFYAEWAAKKPIFITEWATATEQNRYYASFPGEAPWVRSFFKALETNYPRVKGISWFQWDQADGNYLLQRVPDQAKSYASAIEKPRYIEQASPIAGTDSPARPILVRDGSEVVLQESNRAERPKTEVVQTKSAPRRKITLEAVKTETVRVVR